MPLAPDQRRRAASAVERALRDRRPLPSATIPIDDDAWDRFVDRLGWLDPAMTDVGAQADAAAAVVGFAPIRRSSEEAATLLRRIDATLRVAAMFEHPRRPELLDLHDQIGATCRRLWRGLVGETVAPENSGGPEAGNAAVERLRSAGDESFDPWKAAFGVPRNQLVDPRGVVTVPLILAAFYGRLDELQRRIDRLLEPLDVTALDSTKALNYVQALLAADDPIESVEAALHVRELIAAAFAARPDHTAETFRSLLEGVERSHSNMEMILDNRQRIREARRAQTRAGLQLDTYRRMVEGQMRPWCWVLVCLHTRASGPAPMVAQLADRLAATHDDLAMRFLACIEVEARNAAAHEDASWDAHRQVLVSADGDIDTDHLSELAARGHGLMFGAELGWALASGDLPALMSLTHRGITTPRPMILDMNAALSRFGTNDLRIDEWSFDIDTLTVTVRDLPFEKYNPCAQAILEASMYLGDVERIAVHVRGRDGLAMVASKDTLKATGPLWFAALRDYVKMPPATFLPVLVESRLAVETPAVAGRAAAWLALNEAVHCLDVVPWALLAAGMSPREVLREPACGLDIAAKALKYSIAVTGTGDDPLVVRGQRAIEGASIYARHALDGPLEELRVMLRHLSRLDGKIRELLVGLPACAPLPTMDTTPLTAVDDDSPPSLT